MNTHGYVLIYNPISNEGHLDSWHVLFIEMLRKEGWRIIALTTDAAGLQAKLTAKGLTISGDLIVCQVQKDSVRHFSLIRRIYQSLNAQYDRALYQAKPANFSQSVKRTGIVLAHALVAAANRLYRSFKQAAKSNVVGATPTEAVLDPAQFAEAVNEVLTRYPRQIAQVLNMYVDTYRVDAAAWDHFRFSENIPWSAVCITPGPEPVEAYYRVPAFQGICFLDERLCAYYQQALPSKHFEYMPDITDVDLPAQRSPFTKKIIEQAAGRKVVFMGGSIGKQKNLAIWYELIQRMDPTRWYFVQIGRIHRNNLTQADQLALDAVVADHPANLTIYPDYLPDEREFNEVIAVADVIFAVYRGFKRSSNMLSKAAYFEKPILVSDAYLMGERVSRYKIGLAVKEDDVDSILGGFSRLEATSDRAAHFEAYRQDFNLFVAQKKLSRFIQAGLAEQQLTKA